MKPQPGSQKRRGPAPFADGNRAGLQSQLVADDEDSAPDIDLQLVVARRLVLRYALALPAALVIVREGLGVPR